MILVAAIWAASIGSRHVRLTAVGDVMLGRWVARRIERRGATAIFSGVESEFRKADLLVGNLECALTSAAPAAYKPILLKGDPSLAPTLGKAGFSIISLANNHSRDFGSVGVQETKKALTAAGIWTVGPGTIPTVIERNGLKIGILGLVDLPDDSLPSGGEWRQSVRFLRQRVDTMVVMLHWGIEGKTEETPRQRQLARTLADLGVDVIIGSHPHVLQPIRWISGPQHRRCLVAYSLGNFVFDARPGRERESEILSVELGPSGALAFEVAPVRIDRGFPSIVKTPKSP